MSDDLARFMAAVDGEDPSPEFVSALRNEIDAELVDDHQGAVITIRFTDRSVEAADESGDDVSAGDRLPLDEVTAPTQRRRSFGVVTAAAATILVVAGVLVVVTANRDGEQIEPASSAGVFAPVRSNEGAADPLSLSEGLTRLPHDNAVFGGAGRQRMFSVTVGGPGLVAVGISDDDAAVWTSADGITWSRVPHDEAIFGGDGEQWMFSVIAAGPGLVAVGYDVIHAWDDTDAAVWTSVDGIDWSRVPRDEAIFGGARMSSVTIAGPGLVAVGTNRGGDSGDDPPSQDWDAAVWTSVDGTTWSLIPHDEAVFGGANNQEMMDITVGGPGLVAVGTDGRGVIDNSPGQIAAVWTSVDGLTWSRVPHETISGRSENYPMWSVTGGGPGLVAVGWDGRDAAVWTSTDGLTWAQVPHDRAVFGATGFWEMVSVSTVGSGLVAVGAAVWASEDGHTWSLLDNPAPSNDTMWSVTAAGSGLVAVGDDNTDHAAVWVATTRRLELAAAD